MRYKPDQRVHDPFLGDGTIVEANLCGIPGLHKVLWDKTPPIDYNMGENPSAWLPGVHGEEVEVGT